MAKSFCNSCKETFKSVSGFDAHKIGDFGDPIYGTNSKGNRGQIIGYTHSTRRCLTVEEMLAKGFIKNEKGLWITKAYDASVHADEEDDTAEEE